LKTENGINGKRQLPFVAKWKKEAANCRFSAANGNGIFFPWLENYKRLSTIAVSANVPIYG
jgi:hypothetical protein